MSTISVQALASKEANVFECYYMRDSIKVNPSYQRNSDIWTLEKKQLLIDSIINGYDLPKIYFHRLQGKSTEHKYAIIDGRQRLETMWKFIGDEFPLAKDFHYLEDRSVELSGLKYSDLARDYPIIKNRFDATSLPVMIVETEDEDLIDDMFSRLNEAVPLNAAEKRNAWRGHCMATVKRLAENLFFKKKLRFKSPRYQHMEVAIKLLYLEECMSVGGKIADTKKASLDSFAKKYKKKGERHILELSNSVVEIIDKLYSVFLDKDVLLSTQTPIPIYYLVARRQLEECSKISISRKHLEEFHDERQDNRKRAEDDIEKADFELLEYDRLSQQGTNDASSLRERSNILFEYLEKYQ